MNVTSKAVRHPQNPVSAETHDSYFRIVKCYVYLRLYVLQKKTRTRSIYILYLASSKTNINLASHRNARGGLRMVTYRLLKWSTLRKVKAGEPERSFSD